MVIPQANKDQQFVSIDSSGSRKRQMGDMRGLMDIKKAEILDSIEDRYLIVPPPVNASDVDYFQMSKALENANK